MTWQLNVSGHVDGDAEKARSVEEEIASACDRFIDELRSTFGAALNAGRFSGTYVSRSYTGG